MKETVLLILASCSIVLSAKQCCPNNVTLYPRAKCGLEPMRALNCSYGRMVLRDIILDGDKLSTQDSPSFIFAEDPNQYCLGSKYRNFSNKDLGLIPVAVVCFDKPSSSNDPIGSMYRNLSNKDLGLIPVAVVCFDKPSSSNDIETSGILTLVSVIFLIATIGIYTYLPQLRDLQGLCYMCMCISMAMGFLSLGMLQLNPGFRGEMCTLTGFLVYSWMIATFFWMNVISINMYRTVIDASHLKKTERRQFFGYSSYAWGCTIIFLVAALITNFAEGKHFRPGFGQGTCWFSGRTETWIFFYGPIAVLITSNVILFILSSVHLWRDTKKYEINTLNILKNKFLLSLKLFLVMGVSWIFEIASFAHGEAHIIWKIMDIFNCLQGVIIFLLLVVLRKRAMRGLAAENCCLFVSRPLAEKLSPHDDSDDQDILCDDTVEVRLN